MPKTDCATPTTPPSVCLWPRQIPLTTMKTP
jgi:hypothetical protein